MWIQYLGLPIASTYIVYIVRKPFVPAKWVEAEQGSGFISSAMAM